MWIHYTKHANTFQVWNAMLYMYLIFTFSLYIMKSEKEDGRGIGNVYKGDWLMEMKNAQFKNRCGITLVGDLHQPEGYKTEKESVKDF